MTLFLHEMRRGRRSLLIWSIVISFMLAISILIYPEMSSQMEDFSQMFAEMGAFSSAFGLDRINFGEFIGFFAIEAGNTLSLGGAMFAAILGISALAGEESEKTAEFLLAHPVSRRRILMEKHAAVLTKILLLNLMVATVALAATFLIGESIPWSKFFLVFFAMLLMQLQIGTMTFGLSALGEGNPGIGIGIPLGLYFANLLANLTEEIAFIRYFTPYSYADGATVVDEGLLLRNVLVGFAMAVVCFLFAYFYYPKKDIR